MSEDEMMASIRLQEWLDLKRKLRVAEEALEGAKYDLERYSPDEGSVYHSRIIEIEAALAAMLAEEPAEKLAAADTRQLLGKAEKLLLECVDSLEYVNTNHPGTSGWGVRAELVGKVRTFLKDSPNARSR